MAGAIVIWRGFRRNLVWKLASLALAVLLWSAVVGEPEGVTVQAVPVLYRNLSRDLLATDTPAYSGGIARTFGRYPLRV